LNLTDHTHRRLNILTGDWVLVSPHRMKRPWQGKVETLAPDTRPQYDPKCYLCPTNNRAGGAATNPDYADTFVFDNDFMAITPDIPKGSLDKEGLLIAKSERGMCRVICYSPRHDLTMGNMSIAELLKVIDLWTQQYTELGSRDYINYVQIFENKGAVMGCSNPHPHGQIWAQETLPSEVEKETQRQKAHYEKHGRTLLSDYLKLELEEEIRIVCMNDSFVALVPFWAVWPYETMIVSREAVTDLTQLSDAQQKDLAQILQKLTATYDKVFDTSFPYSMGIHQSPTDGKVHPEWHFHLHFYPPLLRSATVKKFMVGYEMMGEPQRDLTAEFIAKKLRQIVELTS